MGSAKSKRPLLVTVGATQEPGVVELLAPGRMVYLTPLSVVAEGFIPRVGYKALATLTGARDEQGRELVATLRSCAPSAEELAKFLSVTERLESIGLGLALEPSPSAWLEHKHQQAVAQSGAFDDLAVREALSQWAKAGRRFPVTSWLEDVSPAVEEMEAHLRRNELGGEIDPKPLEDELDQRLADGMNEEKARRHTTGLLVRIANERATAAGRAERFFAFGDVAWEDDPLWLWLTPHQAAVLLSMRLLKRARAPETQYAVNEAAH